MVRNIVLLSGSSHPTFVDRIASALGVAPSSRVLTKFASGETRCEIRDSVRGKDVYIVQSFGVGEGGHSDPARGTTSGGKHTVNDYFIELCIMISACKTGGAKRVTAVLPLFPYSRQPDLPFSKAGEPLVGLTAQQQHDGSGERKPGGGAKMGADCGNYTTHDYESPSLMMALQATSGQKHFMAHAGSLVANLLTCAGADRILTCDLHEKAYQGFFDIPVDNLYARPHLKRYIQQNIPNYRDAVIVSPDAGGAKRATAIADSLGLAFALIHKERRPPNISLAPKAAMMLVGDVASRVCILVDDLADTGDTIVRAARLLKREGAERVIALLTHGVLSGDAAARIDGNGNGDGDGASSALDRVVVTNTVPQEAHQARCTRLEVLDISGTFAEAIRRVHHGESVRTLFQYD
ncbi:phosphoribosyltransferase-like protein [Corynascus novoguineensis]|uniref:ribose-phosphate diphosphokinase n=1 Tax=Corynascus novoguineensis TaxID=1126955 RepID=A0AAN7CYH0_9PEZI|nr:phosphoribosyltransferase-like protein [Corynascus novoguineensis]